MRPCECKRAPSVVSRLAGSASQRFSPFRLTRRGSSAANLVIQDMVHTSSLLNLVAVLISQQLNFNSDQKNWLIDISKFNICIFIMSYRIMYSCPY
eukprot:SAG31_NODE_1893_length_6973_cov_5.870963_5_plen_96_part_00